MLNTTNLKIIFLLLMIGIVFWCSNPIDQFKTKPILLALPIFKHCSCDSATFCLNDEDVISLHAWYENAKHFTKGKDE